MKKHFTISLIVVGLAAFFAVFSSNHEGVRSFIFSFGSDCCFLGLLCMIIGLIVVTTRENNELGKAFLMSAGITFLVGTGLCSTMLITMH